MASWQVLDTIRDEGGELVVEIRRRKSDTTIYSFCVFKEFARGGIVERTAFLHTRHAAAAQRLIDQARQRIEQIKQEAA
jgi:hypothetical protein